MFTHARLRIQDEYSPHYSFFNQIRRSVGEHVATKYLENVLIPRLEKTTKNLFLRMHISKAEAPTYSPLYYEEDYLYVLRFFDEFLRTDYFMGLPIAEYARKQIVIPENRRVCFYERRFKFGIGEREEEKVRVILALTEEKNQKVTIGRIIKDFNTKDEMVRYLKSFGYVIPEDGLNWLSKVMAIFHYCRYTPDSLYLECEKGEVESLKIDELKPTPHAFNHFISSWRKVGELSLKVLTVKPKRVHVFEVKTTNPLNLASYTPNQKKFINSVLQDAKRDLILLRIVYIPFENYVPLRGAFRVLVYEFE